eukprot:CAMPEP_0119071022 /NCGR_PEP_ID=MMETSP1178-20130426/47499_1 /TAXON_ID=33656 /ORGANISM="unid sp, Strain CCMP2000" /LENGTH=199 /DNA_ID=CAMNT_0007052913 /DNA_START=105 /DNA_END=704 /DNA_ORIENTATION=+
MTRPMPLRLEQTHRTLPAVVMVADDEDDYNDSEEDNYYDDEKTKEDVNLAWNRYSLEHLFQTYEVAYETAYVEEISYEYEYTDLTEEQQAEAKAHQRRSNVVNSLVGGLVACACMAVILHTYIMHTGGIVIAPGTALQPIELHNFRELSTMPSSAVQQLHLPMAPMRLSIERALQSGELVGWRSLLVEKTFPIVLKGAL